MSRKNLLTTLTIALLLPLLVACGNRHKFRIGVSQCSDDDWRKKMNEEIMREIILHPEATVEIRSADDNNDKQIADIRYFLDNDFDIIIAAPNEADAITPVIKEAYEGGTPVILFDRRIHGDTYTSFQGADNEEIGRSAARYAAHLVPEARVLEVYGLQGSTPAAGRHKGFETEGRHLDLKIVSSVFGNWNYEDAARVVDSALNVHPDVQIIYAHNDRMAIAASEVARKKGLNIKIIGVDAAPEIGIRAVADSVIDATFLYPTEGYTLVRTAIDVLNGKQVPRELVLPSTSAVDSSNADILLTQNNALKEETAKIRALKLQVDDYLQRHSAQTLLFYATIAILVLLLGVIFLLMRTFWMHKRHQAELIEQNRLLEQQRDTEKALNEQLNVATQSKLIFFTNVSHDLRTPLTLIAEPVEQLADADNLTPRQHSLMRIARKNVHILKRLINQILDFRKYENGKLSLNLTEASPTLLLAEWAESFTTIARKRSIKLTIDIQVPDDFTMALDTGKVERVFFNLMSNAFKYSPDNARITMTCSVVDGNFILSVADTGKGISPDDLPVIFDRFYQVDKVNPNGSGIGLSLAKAFVELHGGNIAVESEPGKGTTFTVKLPVTHVEPQADTSAPAITEADAILELDTTPLDEESEGEGKPLLLVIDDNADIRSMINLLMRDDYRIIEASDGKEGLRLATRYVPDLIICDVMMPVMDGLEFCRVLKGEVSTSHIPVLMLTACSLDEQRTRGYESGADGYLAKPFDSAMLRMRCRNLIDNRKRIRELWESRTPLPLTPADTDSTTPADAENEFYSRFLTLVSEEMGNATLSVDELAGKLGLGRSQFYRKIKALTNFSPVELLRNLRLKRAHELLLTTSRSVSEIAYEVGFSTPAYFTRCYREQYGETPTEARTRLGR